MNKEEIAHLVDNAVVYDVATVTPLQVLKKMTERVGNTVLLKREDLQPVHSFKIRGAYQKIYHLSDEEKRNGVIASSAGNHAQGVANACATLSISGTIVMPKTTPSIKVEAVRAFGATVILEGDTYDAAYAFAMKLSKEKNLTFIHPYDDYEVIAGQGTVGKEIITQAGEGIDIIFVPTGGGGLLAGVIAYVKTQFPDIKIISVEPDTAACLKVALETGERTVLDQVGIFADGVAVKQIGKYPFELIQHNIDDAITVDTDEICAAIKDIYEDTRSIAEPAGALALAGLKKYCSDHQLKGKKVIAINSGANLNFDRLRHIAERADIGEHTEALFSVEIPEKPGSFLDFCAHLGDRSVTEFNYRYADKTTAKIFVGVALKKGVAEKEEILKILKSNEYKVQDLTDNELAKLHIRHLVGGRQTAFKEELYRFRFPEKPGALSAFLELLSTTCNITLFHYRNHGAAYGRVLAGFQILEGQDEAFKTFLDKLDYPYFEETENPAYKDFL